MNPSSALAANTDAASADDDGRFAVTSILEIGQILQNLARRAVLLTAEPAGCDLFLTTVLGVDLAGSRMWLDSAPSAEEVNRVIRAPRMTCSGSLEKVQIRFSCSGIEVAKYDGRLAFLAPLPRSVSRLQRREHFRMQTPLAPPLKCAVTYPRDGRPVRLELVVADISCGGICLTLVPGQFEPVAGESYDCSVTLPGGTLNTTVKLLHAQTMKGAHGRDLVRAGFSFVNPPATMITVIQRYIMQLERERRAKSL